MQENHVKYERILDDIDSFKVPGVGSVAAQSGEVRSIRITTNGTIETTNKPIASAIEISQDELRAVRNIGSTAIKDLTTEFGEQAVYQLIKCLKGQGLQKIYAAGGKNL